MHSRLDLPLVCFSAGHWSVDYEEKLKPSSKYMGASCVVFVAVVALCLLLVTARLQSRGDRQEGMSTAGPPVEKLVQTNSHNVEYLQGAVADMKKVYDYMMDVSGQSHTNQEALKRVAKRANQVRDRTLHGAPPKKMAATPGEAEQRSVRPPS